ncbi:hypothetical protein B0H13DRAFT_2281447 [Mycena leptocephala]|nr:hypothetical protein B0H13DRAFT_2281447 [Mycena leptocephala]
MSPDALNVPEVRDGCVRGGALRARGSYGGIPSPPLYGGAAVDATSARGTFVWTRAHTRVRFQDADMYQRERGSGGGCGRVKAGYTGTLWCVEPTQSFQFRYTFVIRYAARSASSQAASRRRGFGPLAAPCEGQ